MDKPTIEKNIPMPVGRKASKYNWVANLEIGDSFVLEETKRYGVERISKKCGFRMRASSQNQERGYLRFWRVE